jgi:hypothetical protein
MEFLIVGLVVAVFVYLTFFRKGKKYSGTGTKPNNNPSKNTKQK